MLVRTLALIAPHSHPSRRCRCRRSPGAPPLPPQPKVRPAGIPAGALLVSPCVKGMGEHWANPRGLPFGRSTASTKANR